MKKILKNKKGFTLVELIVVIAILGVLAVIMVPAFTGYVQKANESKEVANAKSWCTAYQAAYADVESGTDTWVLTNAEGTGKGSLPEIKNASNVVLTKSVSLTGVTVDASAGKCTVNP